MNAVFCGQVDTGERLRRRILRNLERRYCMRVDELCLRLGECTETVSAELESLMLSGLVKRIRPVQYGKSDLDVYAMPRPEKTRWEVLTIN